MLRIFGADSAKGFFVLLYFLPIAFVPLSIFFPLASVLFISFIYIYFIFSFSLVDTHFLSNRKHSRVNTDPTKLYSHPL